MNENALNIDDKIAMAEAYRVYELLSPEDQGKIPEDFVNRLLYYGDFKKVKPYSSMEDIENGNISRNGLFLVMYMCTYK